MKKLTVLVFSVVAVFLLSACGNQKFFDTTWTFNYAQFELPNGRVISGELSSWRDYDGEQLQLTMADGNTYLVSSFNTVLSVYPIEETSDEQ